MRAFASRRLMGTVALLGLLPLILLTAIAIDEAALGTPQLARTQALVLHTSDVIRATRQLEVAAQDAERGQRGYLLTDDPRYLAPYTQSQSDIPAALARLRQLTEGDPAQQAQVARMQSWLTEKMAELDRTLAIRRESGREAALALVKTNHGDASMRAFLGELDAFIDAQNAALADRLGALRTAGRRLTVTTIAASVLGAMGLLIAAAMLVLGVRRIGASEARLRATFDSVPQGVAAIDAQGRLLACNDAFAALTGLDMAQAGPVPLGPAAGGRPFMPWLAEAIARATRDRRGLHDDWVGPGEQALELHANPSPDGGCVVMLTDVTERRRAEAFQRQAQKMHAIGQMTGGIAHDFNNLLTIVIGSLDRLTGLLPSDHPARRHADLAMRGAERGARLNRQLLAFARRQPLEPRVIEPAKVLSEIVDLVRRTLGERIDLHLVGPPDLWRTLVDPQQLEAAVVNLALNARDAMPDGGKLTVETGNVTLDDAYAARHDEVVAGDYVLIAVTDTGTGMPPEVAARAFDPFFTTKAPGQGSGLGLSQIYGFAKQSGGHIKIYSEPGHGTTVKLYLPRATDAAAARPAAPAGGEPRGSESVLVVEDDPGVRMTVTGLLADLGYRTLEAADGTQALAVLDGREPIDLLFTDVVMPGPIGSRALAAAARTRRPGLKVLFTSGYTENSIIHQGRLDPGVQLLGKPYRREELAVKLRAVLDQAPASEPERQGASSPAVRGT